MMFYNRQLRRLQELSREELIDRLWETRRQLFVARSNPTLSVKDTRLIRGYRVQIRQIMRLMREL